MIPRKKKLSTQNTEQYLTFYTISRIIFLITQNT